MVYVRLKVHKGEIAPIYLQLSATVKVMVVVEVPEPAGCFPVTKAWSPVVREKGAARHVPDPLLVTTAEQDATWMAETGTVAQFVKLAVLALMLIVSALLLSPPLEAWLIMVDPEIDT